MRSRKPSPDQCGRCGIAFTPGRWTIRSRYSNKPLCGSCGTAGAALADVQPYRAGALPPASREQIAAEIAAVLGPRPDQRSNQRHAESIAAQSDVLHRLATHEAGHAVVARALGLPLREVAIDARHGGINRFHADQAPAGWGPTEDAAVLMAGVLAERRWCPRSTLEGSEDDEAALSTLISSGPALDLERAKATADEVLLRGVADVEQLVDALIRRRHLTGDQVDALLGEEVHGATRRSTPWTAETRTGYRHGGRVVEQHKFWVEYDPDQPPQGWDRSAVEAYNAMHRASEVDNWPLFRQLQERLGQLTRERW